MAIVNRDCEASQQVDVIEKSFVSVASGATLLLAMPAYPCTVKIAAAWGSGVSYAPILSFFKVETLGASAQAVGISGLVVLGQSSAIAMTGFSGLAAAGSTLLNMNAGQLLVGAITGTSANIGQLAVSVVLKKTQDVVSYFGQVQ